VLRVAEDSFVVKEPNPYKTGQKGQDQPADNRSLEKKNDINNETCFNHPWRPASARCNFCKRPFCYADLIEHDNVFYCFEDAYRADVDLKQRSGPNRFTYLSSTLFLCCAALVIYFIIPQLIPVFGLYSSESAVLFSTPVSSISAMLGTAFGYLNLTISFLLSAIGVVCSFAVLSNKKKRIAISAIVLAISLVFFSYEYMTTQTTGSIDYLLYAAIISSANLCVLVIDRINYVGLSTESKFYGQGEWPKSNYH
jgi:hypothetical protein